MAFSVSDGERVLKRNFAPWVQDLGLVVTEIEAPSATLRLPWSDQLTRAGGAISGQALMAAADTATVLAVCAVRGAYVDMTTVQLATTFQRPVLGGDVLITATVTKAGRTLAFADIELTADGRLVARATTVYALLG
jgi:uncharacterized protein (TIGR00369 family)